MANLRMVCSYRPSCIDLPVALVDCQMKNCESLLYHVYQGDYVAMHDVNIEGVDQKICRNCVDDIWIGGKPEKLKKVQHITM